MVCACAVVPESISELTALTELALDNNQISGELQREGCGEGWRCMCVCVLV